MKKYDGPNETFLAIPDNRINDELENWAINNNIPFFRGSCENVLKRFHSLSHIKNHKYIVRITSDCPFVDPVFIEILLNKLKKENLDYVRTDRNFPDGLDIELFLKSSLTKAFINANSKHDLEHVTPFIIQDMSNKIGYLKSKYDLSKMRLTLDEIVDLGVLRIVYKHFNNFEFGYEDLNNLYLTNPEIFENNMHLNRDEGASMSTGEKLWKRATNVIAGGNMLLSKHPSRFMNAGWPTYFSKTRGCHIWDLDDNKFTDVSLMGVGTNILGYSHPKVDEAVRKVIDSGNLSTLNAPEEVLLAEKLIEIHPWADKVKFARTGGEANAIAIRIARAATGKNKILFCGYHGWHDWYLAANIENSNNLDQHLLKGLNSTGVPNNLINTAEPFFINDLTRLKSLIHQGDDIAAVIMEVKRNYEPEKNFLSEIRQLTKNKNIVLIFDECTSGFRETYGGLHLKYGINPDIAVFGKTLGNGYAITAVIGINPIMEVAKKTFISSTFWTERIGSAAAIATLEVMKSTDSARYVSELGDYLRTKWISIFENKSLDYEISGTKSILTFKINNINNDLLTRYVTKRLLHCKFLATNSLYISTSHTPEILDNYSNELEIAINDFYNDYESKDQYKNIDFNETVSIERLN